MRPYKIDLKFVLGTGGGALYVTKPKGGDRAVASGFTRRTHGWGADIHLLYLIRRKLEVAGILLARKRVQGDKHYCHLYGDNYMCYLRTPIHRKGNMPHFWIIDGNYMLVSSAEEYNKGNEVRFEILGDIFQKRGEPPLQPDWFERLAELCEKGGIPCQVCQFASHPE